MKLLIYLLFTLHYVVGLCSIFGTALARRRRCGNEIRDFYLPAFDNTSIERVDGTYRGRLFLLLPEAGNSK